MKRPDKKKTLLFCTGMLAWSMTACGIYGPPQANDGPSSVPGDSTPQEFYGPPEAFTDSAETGTASVQTEAPPAETTLETSVTVAALYGPPQTDETQRPIPGDSIPEDIYGPPEAFGE